MIHFRQCVTHFPKIVHSLGGSFIIDVTQPSSSSICFVILVMNREQFRCNEDWTEAFEGSQWSIGDVSSFIRASSSFLMINVKINGRFITIDNLRRDPKKVKKRARAGKRKFVSAKLLQLFLEHLNYAPLRPFSAAQRWINVDYGFIKRKFIKEFRHCGLLLSTRARPFAWKMTRSERWSLKNQLNLMTFLYLFTLRNVHINYGIML